MLTDTELQGQMTVSDLVAHFRPPKLTSRSHSQTMLLAGHETSSTTLTWLLWRLSSQPQMQQRLREEFRAARRAAVEAGREEPTMDELEALPYLDAVVVSPCSFASSALPRADPPSLSARSFASSPPSLLPFALPLKTRRSLLVLPSRQPTDARLSARSSSPRILPSSSRSRRSTRTRRRGERMPRNSGQSDGWKTKGLTVVWECTRTC